MEIDAAATLSNDQLRLERARQVLRTEAKALLAVSEKIGGSFLKAADALLACPGNVIVTGMGKSGHVAQKIAATLCSTGTVAFFLHPAEAIHGDLGRVTQNDTVLALSDSGETDEVKQILTPLRESGAVLIGITGRSGSTLARMSDITLCYGPVSEACSLGLAPTTSSTVMMAVGDALSIVLMSDRAFGDEDFGRFHPGGSLGRQLRSVGEMMRDGEQLRVAPADRTIREVFVETCRPGRRTGAVMLTDPGGKLVGLCTDSDLVRQIEQRNSLDRPISEIMTKQPTMLRREQRVRDAIAILKDRHFSEIPVVDDEGRPIGMIDITDVMDLLPTPMAA
ncbi:Arabinose 5-phosphate isomerase KdsD [Planctomycetes bacterium Pan216]|uniref:Arabinose 5-phosphate isomerase KdsD n=1 Tax=Kolteria novifilia TaxID=2527975 RepID=A0A518B6U3_9BACT|nr:Arabinose 5-phosphate isomerase KdsD [Planctomycetes bacterium Pan216]